jgi:hypothetical protein
MIRIAFAPPAPNNQPPPPRTSTTDHSQNYRYSWPSLGDIPRGACPARNYDEKPLTCWCLPDGPQQHLQTSPFVSNNNSSNANDESTPTGSLVASFWRSGRERSGGCLGCQHHRDRSCYRSLQLEYFYTDIPARDKDIYSFFCFREKVFGANFSTVQWYDQKL